MKFFPLYLLLGFIINIENACATPRYTMEDTRNVNGVLYDVNGDPVTGIFETFYENNFKKSELSYVDGILNGVAVF